MNVDGTDQVNLTNNPSMDSYPTWSPDGSRIAFYSDRDGNNEIYTMNAGGSNLVNITENPSNDTGPAWSPDGSKIVFQSDRDGFRNLYTMSASGDQLDKITENSNAGVFYGDASWSPDGSRIMYFSNSLGNYEVFTTGVDGSNTKNLTNHPGEDRAGSWSPSGAQITFGSNRSGYYEVYVMNQDGSAVIQLTDDVNNYAPDFSADGSLIVYTASPAESDEIYIMGINGQNKVRLTNNSAVDDWPRWQPIPNTSPVLAAKSLSVGYQTLGAIDVLTDATDEGPLSGSNLTISTAPTHGTASIVDGKVKYTPSDGYLGSDSLTYQICDSFLLDQKCSTGVLGITVQAGPTPATPTVSKVGTVQMNGETSVYYTGHKPTFSGTAVAGSTVTVTIHSDPIILTTTADSAGNWSVTPTQDIPNGEHSVIITASKDGSTSPALSMVLGINTGLAATGVPILPLTAVALTGIGAAYLTLRRRMAA